MIYWIGTQECLPSYTRVLHKLHMCTYRATQGCLLSESQVTQGCIPSYIKLPAKFLNFFCSTFAGVCVAIIAELLQNLYLVVRCANHLAKGTQLMLPKLYWFASARYLGVPPKEYWSPPSPMKLYSHTKVFCLVRLSDFAQVITHLMWNYLLHLMLENIPKILIKKPALS